MCQNIFKNQEEKARKEEFTRLFILLAANSIQSQNTTAQIPGKHQLEKAK